MGNDWVPITLLAIPFHFQSEGTPFWLTIPALWLVLTPQPGATAFPLETPLSLECITFLIRTYLLTGCPCGFLPNGGILLTIPHCDGLQVGYSPPTTHHGIYLPSGAHPLAGHYLLLVRDATPTALFDFLPNFRSIS